MCLPQAGWRPWRKHGREVAEGLRALPLLPNFMKNVYNKDAQVGFYPQVCAPIICRNRGSVIFTLFSSFSNAFSLRKNTHFKHFRLCEAGTGAPKAPPPVVGTNGAEKAKIRQKSRDAPPRIGPFDQLRRLLGKPLAGLFPHVTLKLSTTTKVQERQPPRSSTTP